MKKEPKDAVVLVVDDEEALRKFIAFDLRRKGFNVLEAANGRDALSLVLEHKIDVVVSDVRMPGGDGIELLDNIKNYHPGIPVVMFVTGFADLTIEDAYDKGANAVFTKPFKRNELLASINRAVTSKDELWGMNQIVEKNFDFDIALQFPELATATSGKLLSIGRGGMFVALRRKLPVVDAKTIFRIQFVQGLPEGIEGSGIIRWVRSSNSDSHPAGCGVEFEYLNDNTRTQVVDFISDLRVKAFIPKK
jgi:CheY-like chemotaxis protein